MTQKPVALVDLSTRFAAGTASCPTWRPMARPCPSCCPIPAGIRLPIPLHRRSPGTIVTGQAKRLPKDQLPGLYSANFRFNYARFLDDWAYQKLIRPHMAELQDLNGVNPQDADPYARQTLFYIARELGIYNKLLLWYCRKYPYYQDGTDAYYLQTRTLP